MKKTNIYKKKIMKPSKFVMHIVSHNLPLIELMQQIKSIHFLNPMKPFISDKLSQRKTLGSDSTQNMYGNGYAIFHLYLLTSMLHINSCQLKWKHILTRITGIIVCTVVSTSGKNSRNFHLKQNVRGLRNTMALNQDHILQIF